MLAREPKGYSGREGDVREGRGKGEKREEVEEEKKKRKEKKRKNDVMKT